MSCPFNEPQMSRRTDIDIQPRTLGFADFIWRHTAWQWLERIYWAIAAFSTTGEQSLCGGFVRPFQQ